MKSNSFFYVSAALFSSLMIVGCNQNEILTESAEGTGKALKVKVTEKVFKNAGSDSRVYDNDNSTVFEAGDKIGVYIVKDGTEVMQDNVTLTYKSDGSWDGTLYYYEGADYIAYFPYDEAMKNIKTLNDIKTYFEGEYSVDQSTEEAYRKCDLMTAEVLSENVTEGGTLDLSLVHNMSLLEFSIPTYSYRTSASADAYTYGVPLAGLKINVGGEEYTPFNVSEGLYRCIVSPAESYSISGSFVDAKKNKPVNFEKTGVTLASNDYIHYNIKYEGAPEGNNNIRPIAVGDYYYNNGNIVPNDFAVIPEEGCLGVIFSTETASEIAIDAETTCNHGYVLSLKHASGLNSDRPYASWTYHLWNSAPQEWDTVGITPSSDLSSVLEDNNGFAYTQKIMNNIKVTGEDKMKHAIETYGKPGSVLESYKAPEYTTGWFVPSVGQLVELVKNLGGDTAFDGDTSATEVYTKIINSVEKVGGELTGNSVLWSSNISVANEVYGAFVLKFQEGQGCVIEHRSDNGTSNSHKNSVRPILAF